MITCPKCANTLPDWVVTCQFCGTDVQAVPRPKLAQRAGDPDDLPRHGGALPEKTMWGLYYSLCALWVVNGGVSLVQGVLQVSTLVGIVSAVIGGATFLVGIGLILRVELARGIVNFLAGLSIFFGILGLIGSIASIMLVGAFGLLFVLYDLLRIAVAGATIWIIGETQTRAPNI